jgi:hypothetical protein
MHETVRSDPIAYVLNHAYAAATANQEDPHALVAELCASRLYADAMILAIAIQVSEAKIREAEGFWCREMELITSLGIDKNVVLDELGKRTLFWFLASHTNDWRNLPRTTPPSPPKQEAPCSIPPPPPRRHSPTHSS